MTEWAWIEHPTLPGQPARIQRQSLPHAIRTGWVETDPVPELTAADIEGTEIPGADEPVDYTGWLKADLVTEAEARGLDTTGTKDELIARLDGNDVTATEPEEPAEA
jgi:hypothetical protein